MTTGLQGLLVIVALVAAAPFLARRFRGQVPTVAVLMLGGIGWFANPWGPVLCLAGILVIRGLPQWLLYRRTLPDPIERLRFSLLVSQSLNLPIVVASLEVQAGLMSPELGAALLGGSLLVKREAGGDLLRGVIVETEAYCQSEPACHDQNATCRKGIPFLSRLGAIVGSF